MELKKAISLSLFGYNAPKDHNGFDFPSYLRALLMHVRMNRLVFPNWDVVLNTDESTFKAFAPLFAALPIKTHIRESAPLTKAMLWRLYPVFDYVNYSHVICRDLDSPPTYREAQCVQEWINSDLAAHAITDSVSHGVPMLGGMIGFRPQYWPMRTELQHWADMFKRNEGRYDWARKGTDQDFLNAEIYPKFADPGAPAIMQHYLLGMPNTFLPGYRNVVPDIEVEGVDRNAMAESNETCSHMGQAGWLMPQALRFFAKHKARLEDILEVEKEYAPELAYWIKDGVFE